MTILRGARGVALVCVTGGMSKMMKLVTQPLNLDRQHFSKQLAVRSSHTATTHDRMFGMIGPSPPYRLET